MRTVEDGVGVDETAAHRAGDTDAARAAFSAVVEARPDNIRTNFLLADSLAEQGRLEEALELYLTIFQTLPANFRALMGLLALHLRRDEAGEAEAVLDRAISAAGDDAQKLLRIGIGFRKIHRNEKAKIAFQAAVANSSGALKARAEKSLASVK